MRIENWLAHSGYFQFSVFIVIVSAMCFLLSALREVADTLQVADDAGHIVHILAVADGTLFQIPLVDVAAVVTDGVGYIEGEIVATFGGGHVE